MQFHFYDLFLEDPFPLLLLMNSTKIWRRISTSLRILDFSILFVLIPLWPSLIAIRIQIHSSTQSVPRMPLVFFLSLRLLFIYSLFWCNYVVDQFNTKFHSRPDVDLKSNGEIIEHEEESKGEASADKMRRDRSRLEVVEKRSRRQRTNRNEGRMWRGLVSYFLSSEFLYLDFDVRVNVAIARRNAVVSIDTSAEPLFRRGYRQSQVHAALQGNKKKKRKGRKERKANGREGWGVKKRRTKNNVFTVHFFFLRNDRCDFAS